MPTRPYFSITRDSFEKNAGYKTTVHALAELIDNAFEAGARESVVILQIDRNQRLETIAVVDNGSGMDSQLLQMAVCEKAGSYLSRQRGHGPQSRRKLGKYGVGLPKASISQCNRFSVWSWQNDGPGKAFRNGVDITDEDWIDDGAEVPESWREGAPAAWIDVAGIESLNSGTLVLWEDLDGVTWARARWGEHSGLIPNLHFEVGRVYRKLINDPDADFSIRVIVVNHHMKVIEQLDVEINDPLYLTKGMKLPREELDDGTLWPPDDPLFDDVTGSLDRPTLTVLVPREDGTREEVVVRWRVSAARKNTFATLNGRFAGNLPHGRHARRNVGLSILREGREINLSTALANPSEPRERWWGVEVELPHDLDRILGMTNNKQEYTRLEQVLTHDQRDYMEEGESTRQCLERIEREDPELAICLRIAWQCQDIWRTTRSFHLNMREEVVSAGGKAPTEPPEPLGPEEEAEESASGADPDASLPPDSPEERDRLQEELESDLVHAGLPKPQAKQMAARVIDRGLAYAISARSGLGSPFFTASTIKGVKLIQLNTDHPAYEYIRSGLDEASENDSDSLEKQLENARVAILLMLEAWAKLELEAQDGEQRHLQRMREDWGRLLDRFIRQLETDRAERGAG